MEYKQTIKMENKRKHSMKSDAKARRARVIERLETQLKAGTKVLPDGSGIIDLTEKDVDRIKDEITVLKTRI